MVYFIEGGFQSAQQEFEIWGKVTVKYGYCPHASECIKEGISGQHFFTGLAWATKKSTIMREVRNWVKCKNAEIEIVEA